MDLFSLVDGGLPDQGGEFSADDASHDGFATPRSAASDSLATPRSLFSTPPRTPRTPPHPTSRVDDRLRMRRYKLAMSPCPSPRESPEKSSRSSSGSGGDVLSESSLHDPLRRRVTDVSFSSGGEDSEEWNGSNDNCSYSPNVTPNNSPRRSDLLSLSPIQKRLERARTKRQQILEERVQNIDAKSREKEELASRRKEDATLEKVGKARTGDAIEQAKSKRRQMHDERVQQIDEKARLKEESASKRKEDVTLEKVEKARSELAKSPVVKERREQRLAQRLESIEATLESKKEASKRKEDATLEIVEKARSELAKPDLVKERREQQLALRVESIEATLESKTEQAQRRLERHLLEKQRRASGRERKARAERRRKLISYEKRAKLLASLDAKLERAALNSSKYTEERAARAAEDIAKAKEVARRVKAARTVQSAVRGAFGFDRPEGGEAVGLSQRAAAERLQRWLPWRARACARRLLVEGGGRADGGEGAAPETARALERLLQIFSPASRERRAQHFEMLNCKMVRPDALRMGQRVAGCLRPLLRSSSAPLDARTLLSLLLIAVHPGEVLGEDYDRPLDEVDDARSGRGGRLLASASQELMATLGELSLVVVSTHRSADSGESVEHKTQTDTPCRVSEVSALFAEASKSLQKALTLFRWWKTMDLEQLLANLSTQLEQSWAVYLTSSDTLKYLSEVTGVDASQSDANRDDPLMSLRLRHEAGRNGSRSHIKRIRSSLNKLIGAEEGKAVVKSAKAVALREIEESGVTGELRGEVDEIYGGLGLAEGPANTNEAAESDGQAGQSEQVAMSVALPDEILSNRLLVHRILLTDPSDFDKLSWVGMDAQSSSATPGDFMASFVRQSASDESGSTQDMPLRIAHSMRKAFFDQIISEMSQGNFGPARELLTELHAKMRALLPSRKDIHSHINDEDIASCASTGDMLGVMIRSGYLLSNYLESAARAPTTQELVGCLEGFLSGTSGENSAIPYGLESRETLVVASIAYILHKAELCQMDISNYKLAQAAPLLHHVGHEYERKNFRKTHGDYGSSSIEELKHILPSTWSWIEQMQSLYGSGENLTAHSSLEHKMDFVKGKGFVDGVLFTRSQIALPEFLSLDVESINRIRSEARCCVIASALVLHACNISRVVNMGSGAMTDEANEARETLSCVLRKRHFQQEELESSVIEAVNTMTKALAERDLVVDELATLKNHTLAVLHGNDPVLKLLDNRVQSFFRFACKWKSDASQPLEMKTGRSVLKSDTDVAPRHGLKSTKEEFSLAANREASRLGFANIAPELIRVGNEARGIIGLAWANFGTDILDRFLVAASQG